jgi:hypothetical protein
MKKLNLDLELLKMLINDGKSSDEISKQFNCSAHSILNYAKLNNISWNKKNLQEPKKTKEMLGKTFNKLTIISFAVYKDRKTTKSRDAFWNCNCSCGTKNVLVSNSNLISGHVKSCGCYMIEKLKVLHKNNIKLHAPFYSVLKEYTNGAKIRNLSFDLNETQFKKITKSNCYYCNEPPSTIKYKNGKYEFKGEPYIYNGIDRVDNDKGYILENCVSCCRDCNWMKGVLNKEKFFKKIKEIYNYQFMQ